MNYTQVGTLQYPWLNEPDTQFHSAGKFHTKLILEKDKAQNDIQKINQEIEKMVAAKLLGKSNINLKRANLPYDIQEDGSVKFTFRLNASGINSKTKEPFTQRPELFDKENNNLPTGIRVSSGSKAKVAYEIIPFDSPGVGLGVSLRLKGVQVVELKNSNAVNFQEEN